MRRASERRWLLETSVAMRAGADRRRQAPAQLLHAVAPRRLPPRATLASVLPDRTTWLGWIGHHGAADPGKGGQGVHLRAGLTDDLFHV